MSFLIRFFSNPWSTVSAIGVSLVSSAIYDAIKDKMVFNELFKLGLENISPIVLYGIIVLIGTLMVYLGFYQYLNRFQGVYVRMRVSAYHSLKVVGEFTEYRQLVKDVSSCGATVVWVRNGSPLEVNDSGSWLLAVDHELMAFFNALRPRKKIFGKHHEKSRVIVFESRHERDSYSNLLNKHAHRSTDSKVIQFTEFVKSTVKGQGKVFGIAKEDIVQMFALFPNLAINLADDLSFLDLVFSGSINNPGDSAILSCAFDYPRKLNSVTKEINLYSANRQISSSRTDGSNLFDKDLIQKERARLFCFHFLSDRLRLINQGVMIEFQC